MAFQVISIVKYGSETQPSGKEVEAKQIFYLNFGL